MTTTESVIISLFIIGIGVSIIILFMILEIKGHLFENKLLREQLLKYKNCKCNNQI